MVATSSSEVALAANHPKPAGAVPCPPEGPQVWAGGQPPGALPRPPEGPQARAGGQPAGAVPSPPERPQPWAGAGETAGETQGPQGQPAGAVPEGPQGQPAGAVPEGPQGQPAGAVPAWALPWPSPGVGVGRKPKKCSGSNSGTMASRGLSAHASRIVTAGNCPSRTPDNNTEADLRTSGTIALDSKRTHRPTLGSH
jgi:hypothetical protein